MTLYRQLLIFTLILFFVLFVGVWVDKLQSTRSFLVEQLESQAQDTATSLGLSLTPFMVEKDLSTIETMMNAVFDRGYYRIISLRDINEKVISERVSTLSIKGVPSWFIRGIPLETSGATSLVMSGWNQAGSLYIEGHPGYAYLTLWQTAVRITVYFLLTGVFVLILGGFGLRALLRPLKRVESQAEALCRREYEIQEDLPRTRELRQMVETMNRMTAKVRDMFSEQAGIAEKLRQSAYSDMLTGLGNRRYLQGQILARTDTQAGAKGAFLLVHILNLQAINDVKGFAAGDELLKKTAAVLTKITLPIADAALARLTGGDFALFLPEVSYEDARQIAEEITSQLTRFSVEQIAISDNVACVGGVVYEQPLSLSQLLSEADTALQAARGQGPNKYEIAAMEPDGLAAAKGRIWWKTTLNSVLENGEIRLLAQAVAMDRQRERVLHTEVFSRVALDSGILVSAGVFIPLAERLHLIARLDRQVIEKVLHGIAGPWTGGKLAVNISPTSLEDRGFLQWLLERLKALPSAGPRIVFEFIEFSAIRHLDTVRKFAAEVKLLGHSIGLDHFGQSFANFGYLKSLQPEYVKIDRAYVGELATEHGSDSQFFIGALCSAAHSLDILVIAEGVESESQCAILSDLHIDAFQGYLIDQPVKMAM
jgi:diguanylate cyclase (GGDEF)-like protein